MIVNSNPDAKDVTYSSPACLRMETELTLVRDFVAGVRRVKSKAITYLPMAEGESMMAWGSRVENAPFYPGTYKALHGYVGMAFKQNPVLDNDVPPRIRADLEDVDLQGHHFDTFLRDAFTDAITDGHVFIVVDAQGTLMSQSAAGIPDASDEIAAKQRAFWIKYLKDQARSWKSDVISGELVLTQIVFRECHTVDDGDYGAKESTCYRRMWLPKLTDAMPGRPATYGPMQWQLWGMKHIDGVEKMGLLDNGETDLLRLPVVCIYTNQTGFLESSPPLTDLADLNKQHFRAWSGITNQIDHLQPMTEYHWDKLQDLIDYRKSIGDTGAGAPAPIPVGPNVQVNTFGGGKVEYKAHDANCVEPARKNAADILDRMSSVSLSIIAATKDAKQVTLGEKEMDQAERTSLLVMWVRALTDGAEQCLKIHANYYGLEDGGSIIMSVSVMPEAVVMDGAPPAQPQPQPGMMQTTDASAAPVA